MLDMNNALAELALDYIYDTHFPAGSLLQLRSGAPPGAENAASGVLLVEITLPAGPWSVAGATTPGMKQFAGVWSGLGLAIGNIGHFRLKNAAGTRIEDGTVTATGGGGDATIDSIAVTVGKVVSVNSFNPTM